MTSAADLSEPRRWIWCPAASSRGSRTRDDRLVPDARRRRPPSGGSPGRPAESRARGRSTLDGPAPDHPGELAAADLTFGEPIALAEVRLLAPIGSFPRNIFCIGKNYREHALEFTTSGFDSSGGAAPTDVIPTSPIVFSKPFTSVIGPGDLIERHPDLTSMLDYEAELAVVIGRGGRDIAHHDALDHVFGYHHRQRRHRT